MKVLNLRCANGHGFEGWFASDDDFMSQNGGGLIECPICADKVVTRMPSAPRLNLGAGREGDAARTRATQEAPPAAAPGLPAQAADLQAAWLRTVRELLARTEDVGPRFAEEARRIHYGEAAERGIRGKATPQERAALEEEGIETFALPVPRALDGPLQ